MSSSAEFASPSDVEQVTALLGRRPQGDFTVVVRSPDGTPRVVRNAPLLHDGTPMPTRFWLVDPDLRARVSRIESAGGVREAEAALLSLVQDNREVLPTPDQLEETEPLHDCARNGENSRGASPPDHPAIRKQGPDSWSAKI